MQITKSDTKFLGIDLSTQSIKAVVVDVDGHVVEKVGLRFDEALPEFGTKDGVLMSEDGLKVWSPVTMWLKSIDRLLDELSRKIDMSTIRAVSGCGQQHGTVYWSRKAEERLSTLGKEDSLADLGGLFAREECPIWMDSSTEKQCRNIELVVGGALNLAHITGSRAFHRFSGNQIAKIYEEESQVYENTSHISLVSSFVCSLFLGRIAPIDLSDGSGMNLLDIHKKEWNVDCLNATSPGLASKLGTPVPTSTVLGTVSCYLQERFNFVPECQILAFTGDNPDSLAGLCLSEDSIALSLGTSDTVFFSTRDPHPDVIGHVFVHPYLTREYMGMACFKNGSLTRERIRKRLGLSWEQIDKELTRTEPGNDGNIGIYLDLNEIAPTVEAGDYRLNSDGKLVAEFPAAIELRALLEGQFIAKFLYARRLGWNQRGRVIVTGGASANRSLLQLIADVSGLEVHIQKVADSAALGGALRARYAILGKPGVTYDQFSSSAVVSVCVASPKVDREIYEKLTQKYEKFEKLIIAKHSYKNQ